MSALKQDWNAWFIALGTLYWFVFSLVFTNSLDVLFSSGKRSTDGTKENTGYGRFFALSLVNQAAVALIRGLTFFFFLAVWVAAIVAIAKNGIIRGNTMQAETYIRNVAMITIYTVSGFYLSYAMWFRYVKDVEDGGKKMTVAEGGLQTFGRFAIFSAVFGYVTVYGLLYMQTNDSTGRGITGYNIADLVCLSVLALTHLFVAGNEVLHTSNASRPITPERRDTVVGILTRVRNGALQLPKITVDALNNLLTTGVEQEPAKYGTLPGRGVKAPVPPEIIAGYIVHSITVGFEICGDYGSLTIWVLFVVALPIFCALWSSRVFWLEHWIVSHLLMAFAYFMFNGFVVWGNGNFVPEDNPNTRHLFLLQDQTHYAMKWSEVAIVAFRWFLSSVNILLAAITIFLRFYLYRDAIKSKTG
jgi:hypothetical protein